MGRTGRWGALCLVLLVSGCRPGGGSSSSSSTGGSADYPNYTAFCKGVFGAASCSSPACDPFDEARCNTGYAHLCDQLGAETDAEIAAGKLVYNPQGSGACADFYRRFNDLKAQYLCTDPDQYYAAILGLYGYGQSAPPLECSNGVPSIHAASPYGDYAACSQLLIGQVPLGAACGTSAVCASGQCTNRPDGGCGACGESANSFTLVDEGQPCVRHGSDGGYPTYLRCKDNLSCDHASETCMAYAGPGQPCGARFQLCAAGCGLQCSGADGGRGTCENLPGENAPCGYSQGVQSFGFCRSGLTCVGSATDAGYPNQFNASCKQMAGLGAPCSVGINYDSYAAPEYAGGYSYGTHPVCVTGAACAVADGGSTGTCVVSAGGGVPAGPAGTGESCTSIAPNPCAASGEVCNGAGRCAPRSAEGGPCLGAPDECQAGLWCRRSVTDGGGGGQCAPRIANGQPCGTGDTCVLLSICRQGVCTNFEDVAYEPAPLCQ